MGAGGILRSRTRGRREKMIMNPLGIDEEEREHWWQVWRKKKDVPDKSPYYLAFIAGWDAAIGSANRKNCPAPNAYRVTKQEARPMKCWWNELEFICWCPWVHWYWKPSRARTVTEKVLRWLCFEFRWNYKPCHTIRTQDTA